MSLPEATAAQLRGDALQAVLLAEFGFASGVERVASHAGRTPLTTADGRVWRPVAGAVAVEGLAAVADMGAQEARFELARGDLEPEAFSAAARADLDADVIGRPVAVYLQILDAETGAPVDRPLAIWSGVMSQVEVDWPSIGAARITLTAETLFAEKRKPAFGMLTAADQRSRFPGDAGLDHIETLVNRRVVWPRD